MRDVVRPKAITWHLNVASLFYCNVPPPPREISIISSHNNPICSHCRGRRGELNVISQASIFNLATPRELSRADPLRYFDWDGYHHYPLLTVPLVPETHVSDSCKKKKKKPQSLNGPVNGV